MLFTAQETLDAVIDLVLPARVGRRPFKFGGKIEAVHVEMKLLLNHQLEEF
jgi:hypothetical protein